MENIVIGFAMCGSFCTFDTVIRQLETLKQEFPQIQPILSEASSQTDSRFGDAAGFMARIEKICGRPIIRTIPQAEPIGPKKLLDALVIAPCTGNTIAKLANGITDTTVTMAAKAHLRNNRPVILAVSTNDGLSANGKNIGELMNRKNIYFVPFGQDVYKRQGVRRMARPWMSSRRQGLPSAYSGRMAERFTAPMRFG